MPLVATLRVVLLPEEKPGNGGTIRYRADNQQLEAGPHLSLHPPLLTPRLVLFPY